jgi:hypothetical protein
MDTVTLDVGQTPTVHIRMVGGDLRLTGREGTGLEAQASPRGELTAVSAGNRIEVSCRSACLIFLPAGAQVEAEMVGGDVRVIGVDGRLKLGTVGGDLSLRRVGEVSVEKVGGDLTVHRSGGEVEAGWVGGDADIDQIEGGVQLQVVGGDLRVNRVQGAVQATVGGDASLHLSPPAGTTTSLRAGGDISCRLAEGVSLRLTLRAGGDLRAAVAGEREHTPDGLVIRLGEAQAAAELTAGGDLWLRPEAGPGEAERGSRLGEDFHAHVQAQVDAAMAEVEAGLEKLSAGAFGFDSERVSGRVRRAMERAQRRAARARERAAARTGSPRRPADFDFGPSRPARPAVSEEERLSVLQMLEQGSISVEEAERLLQALEGES